MKVTYSEYPELWECTPSLGSWSKEGVEIHEDRYKQFRKEADKIYRHLSPHQRDVAAMHLTIMHPGFHDHAVSPMKTVAMAPHERAALGAGAVLGTDAFVDTDRLAKSLEEQARDFNSFTGAFSKQYEQVEKAANNIKEGFAAAEKNATIQQEQLRVAVAGQTARTVEALKANASIITKSADQFSLQVNSLRVELLTAEDRRMREARSRENLDRLWQIAMFVLMLLALLLLSSGKAKAAPAPEPVNAVTPAQTKNLIRRVFGLPQDVIPPANFLFNGSGALIVTCPDGTCSGGGGGGGGTSSSFGAAFPATGTAAGFIDNSGNMAGGTLDSSGNLKVAQQGSVAVTGPLTDTQLRATAVPVSLASTTITGNVTVVQPTGTNLHTVLDTTSTTAVTQATAGNLNATVVGTGTFAAQVTGTVTANAGTNLNTSLLELDATGAALNLAQASTTSGQTGPLVQTATTTSAPSYTTAKTNPLSTDTSGNLRVAGAVTGSGNFTVVQPTGTNLHAVLDTTSTTAVTQATAGNLNATVIGTGTFATQSAITAASGSIASGAVASGAVASGAIASGACVANCIVDGGVATLGLKADAKSTATDTTAVTIMQVVKEISAMEQAPASRAVTNIGTFVVQNTNAAETTKVLGTVRTLGNVGGIFDTTQNAAVAANSLLQGCNFTSSPATITTANQGAVQCNSKGELLTQITDGTTNVAVIAGTTALKTDMSSVAGTATVTAGVSGAQAVGGCVATNTATPCNPMNLGAQAVSSENSAATTAREVQLVADLVGKLIVLPYANPENFVNGTTAAITDTTSTSVIASAGGSLRNYVTSVIVTNSHATVGTFVKILEGTNIIWEGYAAAVGGGFSTSFPVPLKGAAATAINCQPVTTGANVICSAAGYKGL